MITIYTTDAAGVFAAERLHDPKQPLPRCSLTPPPATTGTQVAYLAGSTWTVLPEYPQPPTPTPDRIQTEIVTATQQRLDDFARTRNYDGILSLCTYATSTVPKFQAEGQYGVTARDATWAKLYAMLSEVEAGTRPVPTGFADIEPELPALTWPA